MSESAYVETETDDDDEYSDIAEGDRCEGEHEVVHAVQSQFEGTGIAVQPAGALSAFHNAITEEGLEDEDGHSGLPYVVRMAMMQARAAQQQKQQDP